MGELNHSKEKHPHSRKYYFDVVMNLLHCQDGVCAYTEEFLCNPKLLSEDKWANGRYKIKKPRRYGQLDHFNPKLKEDKCWEWDNLFVIHSDINRDKWAKEVDDILKPDSPEYDPWKLLEYDESLNVFFPHSGLDDESVRERISRMIEVLQLNHDTVRCKREIFLIEVFERRELGREIKIHQFFTAYQMALTAKEKEE